MADSVREIAQQLAAAADPGGSWEALTRLFAKEVELRHDPPAPTDGPISGALLAQISLHEMEALSRALPDATHDQPEITVEGNAIRIRRRTQGSLPDGTPVDFRTNTVFSIAEGRVVALQSDMDGESVRMWQRVLSAGGFPPPGRPD
jgi:ketosteroid isomerase-like protein